MYVSMHACISSLARFHSKNITTQRHELHPLILLGASSIGVIATEHMRNPHQHDDVEAIMKAAVTHGTCLIPFGGGTRYLPTSK